MESDYTKRELDMKFENLEKKIDDNHAETTEQIDLTERRNKDRQIEILNLVGEVKDQTTLTNGTVKKLKQWQTGIIMSGSVVIFMGSVIVGLVVYIYQYQLNQYATRVSNQGTTIQLLKTQVQELTK